MKDRLFQGKNQGILVDTTPTNAYKPDILNLGYEIVREKWDLKPVHWRDGTDLTDVKHICFNITYPLYILNIAPFLRSHGLSPLKEERRKRKEPYVIVGGAGVSNLRGCLEEIADVVFRGELDAEDAPETCDASHLHSITSPAPYFRKVLDTPAVVKYNTAVLELARGCPHRCRFCEYSWAIGGHYREKPIGLVREQLDSLLSEHPSLRRKGLTLRTSSFGSYRNLHQLSEILCKRNLRIPWIDINPQDFELVHDYIQPLGITRLHLGVESFTEAVRRRAGKRVSDDELALILRSAMMQCYWLHINLIFGLPGEDDVDPPYQLWFDWVKRIDDIRKRIKHDLRIDFMISNFEPSCGTPYEEAAGVDFDLKEKYFLPKWISLLKQLGFYTLRKRKRIWYGSDFGRHGRKRLAHQLIMTIRRGGTELTQALCEAFPSGVRRYTTDKQALRFFSLIEKKKGKGGGGVIE